MNDQEGKAVRSTRKEKVMRAGRRLEDGGSLLVRQLKLRIVAGLQQCGIHATEDTRVGAPTKGLQESREGTKWKGRGGWKM
jgi:hypothetical protein